MRRSEFRLHLRLCLELRLLERLRMWRRLRLRASLLLADLLPEEPHRLVRSVRGRPRAVGRGSQSLLQQQWLHVVCGCCTGRCRVEWLCRCRAEWLCGCRPELQQ
jgi:hypothetical protein